jgi:hypothetical protein
VAIEQEDAQEDWGGDEYEEGSDELELLYEQEIHIGRSMNPIFWGETVTIFSVPEDHEDPPMVVFENGSGHEVQIADVEELRRVIECLTAAGHSLGWSV